MESAAITKTIPVGLCLPADLKFDADRRAKADGRDLSSYIAWLIERDVSKRPIPRLVAPAKPGAR